MEINMKNRRKQEKEELFKDVRPSMRPSDILQPRQQNIQMPARDNNDQNGKQRQQNVKKSKKNQ